MLLDISYHNGKYRTRKLHRRQTDGQGQRDEANTEDYREVPCLRTYEPCVGRNCLDWVRATGKEQVGR